MFDFIKNWFNKKKKEKLLRISENRYKQLVSSIDDKELSSIFLNEMTSELKVVDKKYEKNMSFPLQTTISQDNAKEIARNFFAKFGNEISQKINDIIDVRNPNIRISNKCGDRAFVDSSNGVQVVVNVPKRNDLRCLYELVHELTHTLDIKNGETETRKILGEIAPQCMERMLDDFLLEMTDEDMQKYGFDRNTIEEDIKTRKIMTFLSRYRSVRDLADGKRSNEESLRYMLAQIYSVHFGNLTGKIKRLKQFLNCVENNEFEQANDVFDMEISKENKLQREMYILKTITEIQNLVRNKNEKTSIEDKSIILGIEDKEI